MPYLQRTLGRLEEKVIPLLEPMARGMQLALGHESQQLLAHWANKTAIALLAAEDPGTVPKAHGKEVRDDARVADGTWVGFLPWRGGPVLSTVSNGQVGAPTGPLEAYGALLAFGTVGFVAFGIKGAPAVPWAMRGEPPPLRQFWPLVHRMVDWPPGPPADISWLAGLREFVPI